MKVNTKNKNQALLTLISNPNYTLFLDANFFIPPDRTKLGARASFDFEKFKEIWLEPLFLEFSGLSVHESVYEELVEQKTKNYADEKINQSPSKLQVHYDNVLTNTEQAMYQTHLVKLSQYSKYIPTQDNKDDRGEIKSLSYMQVKGFLYFASNDNLPSTLIDDAANVQSGLDHMSLLHYYDLIYFLYKKGYDAKPLRATYKYLYYLTKTEQRMNPAWGDFVAEMDQLYKDIMWNN